MNIPDKIICCECKSTPVDDIAYFLIFREGRLKWVCSYCKDEL